MKKIILCTITVLLILSTACFAQKKVSYFYPNGNKKIEGQLFEGEKDGEWIEWDEDGRLKSKILYKNGKIQEEKSYSRGTIMSEKQYNQHPVFVYQKKYSSGRLYSEEFRKHDSPIAYDYFNHKGPTFSYHLDETMQKNGIPYIALYEDGTVSVVRCGTNDVGWYQDGTLREINGYFYSTTQSVWYRWNEAGKRVDRRLKVIENDTLVFNKNGIKNNLEYTLKNDRLEGICKDYYPNGQLWFEIKYKNGVPVDDYQSFYINGTPQLKTQFVDGFIDGKYTEWYPNGNKRMEGYLNLCMKDSVWQYWNENGTLIKRESYKNNVLEGEYCQWFKDGSLKEKKNYKNGRLSGWEYVYYAKDSLKSVHYYPGYEKKFYPNGMLEELSFSNVRFKVHRSNNGNYTEIRGDLFAIRWNRDGTLFDISYGEEGKTAYIAFEKDGTIKRNEFRVNGKMLEKVPYKWLYPQDGKIEIKQIGDSINGKREGDWQLYYPSGDLWIEMSYKNDLLDGEYIVHAVNGQIVKKVQLSNGVRNGTYEEWSTTGNKLVEEYYKNGEKDGVQKGWSEQDSYYLKTIAFYTNGVLNGESYYFAQNGDTLSHANYHNGERNGICKVYDRNEHYLSGTYTYKEGKRQGESFIYSKDGNVLWKGNFYNDKRHGTWIQYDGAGTEINRVQYEYGEEILTPIELECQCSTNYESANKPSYTPTLSDLIDYNTFCTATNKYIGVDKKVYDYLFYNRYQSSSNTFGDGGWRNFDVVAFDTVWFETPATKGLRFVINPCLTKNQRSANEISLTTSYPIQRYKRFDANKFDYQSTSFFKLALGVVGQFALSNAQGDEASHILTMITQYISSSQDVSLEEAYKKFRDLLREKRMTAIQLPDTFQHVDSLSESQLVSFWENEEKIVDIFADTYFDYGKINLDHVNAEFENNFNMFFVSNVVSAFTFKDFAKWMVLSYEVQTDINQIAIDFPQNILAQWDTKKKRVAQHNGNTIGARLLLSVNPIKMSSENGFSLENQRNFCFTSAAIGGKNCILKTDNAEVIPNNVRFAGMLESNQGYYWVDEDEYEDSNYEKFIKTNASTDFAGVYIPNGYGTITVNQKECVISYKDVFVTGTYILGQIHLQRNNLENKELTKYLKEYFTNYQIETNTKDETIVYFLYK